MKIVASNSLTVSKVDDGTITHTAYANSADGTDGFTTVYPNLNLLDGTKDFTGGWWYHEGWENDGTYKGLTVKKKASPWGGISKPFTAPKDGIYTFSAYVKSSGDSANILRYTTVNGAQDTEKVPDKWMGHDFDWLRDSFTLTLKAEDTVTPGYNITGSGVLWMAGHKWEEGSTATPHMPSSSEVTTADWPNFIGQYSDFTQADSTNPSDYTWSLMRGDDGISPTVKINPDTSLTIVDAQGTSTTPALKGADGTDGTSGIIVSSVAPASPQTGQLWQDTSTTPQLVKKWTGSSWVIWKMYVENMVVDTISSMSSDLGDVKAGTMKLMADVDVNGAIKKHGIYQSKMGLLSSGPSLSTPSTLSSSQMGVANLNRGELRFIVTNYTEDLKNVQETGMSDPNTAFIQFNSYDNGKDVMLIGSSGDIVFKGITSQDTPWIAMINGTYYKNMFSRVYISYSIKATSTANIPLGVLPVGLRPFRGLHLTANAWYTTLGNDRHIEVRTTGEVTLYNPANGASYDGEVSFTI